MRRLRARSCPCPSCRRRSAASTCARYCGASRVESRSVRRFPRWPALDDAHKPNPTPASIVPRAKLSAVPVVLPQERAPAALKNPECVTALELAVSAAADPYCRQHSSAPPMHDSFAAVTCDSFAVASYDSSAAVSHDSFAAMSYDSFGSAAATTGGVVSHDSFAVASGAINDSFATTASSSIAAGPRASTSPQASAAARRGNLMFLVLYFVGTRHGVGLPSRQPSFKDGYSCPELFLPSVVLDRVSVAHSNTSVTSVTSVTRSTSVRIDSNIVQKPPEGENLVSTRGRCRLRADAIGSDLVRTPGRLSPFPPLVGRCSTRWRWPSHSCSRGCPTPPCPPTACQRYVPSCCDRTSRCSSSVSLLCRCLGSCCHSQPTSIRCRYVWGSGGGSSCCRDCCVCAGSGG